VYTGVIYVPGDCLLFGPESVGLPEEVKHMDWVTDRLRLPMIPGVRSLNLANSASVVVYEAWRQQGFEGSS
jgi:tRNA (cytidine/uridine-2'-O-)-methyltransferase